jgi:hypothetical protein
MQPTLPTLPVSPVSPGSPSSSPRSRSNGLLVVMLGLLLPTCGDDSKSPGLGITPVTGGASGAAGGQGGTSAGQGGSFNPFAGGGAPGQGGSGRGGAGGVPDGGGGSDVVAGTGNASIKFCNLLVATDDMGMTADTTIELTVGTTKVTATTYSCAPAAPAPCATVTPGANRVVMTVIAPQVATPVIYDQMITFAAGTSYLTLGNVNAAMQPVVVSEPFPPAVSCASYVPPPSPMKFCNRYFRAGAAVTLNLNVGGMTFTAASGTCTPAISQACPAVPSGEQMVTLTEGATVLNSNVLIFTPGVQAILHASPVNNLPVLGGLELRDTDMCSAIGYTEVDTFLMMPPLMPAPLTPMKTVGGADGSRRWKVTGVSSRARLPALR